MVSFDLGDATCCWKKVLSSVVKAGYTTTMRKQKKISRYLKSLASRHLKKWQKAFRNLHLRPLGHLKGNTMNFMAKFFPSPGERSLSARITSGATAVLVAFVLAACGGGGGSSTSSPVVAPPDPGASSPVNPPDPGASSPTNPPPPDPGASSPTNPPPAPTGKLEVKPSPDCVIVTEGVGTCPRTLSATDLKNTSGKVAIVTPKGDNLPASASVPIEAPLGNSTYKLVDDKVVLATVTVKVSCDATKLEKQGEVCMKPAVVQVHYDRANLVISGEVFADSGNGTLAVSYPQLIVGTTLILPKNKTGVQVGLCMLPSMKLANGLLPIRCHHDPVKNLIGIFPLDPVKQELLPEYIGELPKDMVFYGAPYGEFGASPYTKYGVSNYGMFIDVPGVGTYYYIDTDGKNLRLTRDGFKSNEVVHTGQDFTYSVLMTYTNPAP